MQLKSAFLFAFVTAVGVVLASSGCSSSDDAKPPSGDGGTACPTSVKPGPGIVVTDKGAVEGELTGNVYHYLGIPFAAPPVGDLRWKAPQEPGCFKETVSAKKFGSICTQPNISNTAEIVGDEDCLTINVWVPSSVTPDSNTPVLVWTHGGGNNYGGSGELDFIGKNHQWDGQKLADKGGVIVVSMNYRLGILGYLVHADLSAENPDKVSGNYGILDQVAALNWVQRNIGAFGGDPKKVTVMGESAGAIDTCMLLAMPRAKGLFNQMILQSSSPCQAETLEDETNLGIEAIKATGCPTEPGAAASCLRAKSARDLVKAYPGLLDLPGALSGRFPIVLQPSLDGKVIPEQPSDAIYGGRHNHAALISGSNREETHMFIPQDMTDERYRATCEEIAQEGAGVFLYVLYPPENYKSPADALGHLTTDAAFNCTARRAAQRVKDHQPEPVYRYVFAHGYEGTGILPGGAAPLTKQAAFGAFHTAELPYVFGNLELNGYVPTESEKALSEQMMGYWLRFVKTGNPNGPGAPVEWPAYESKADPFIVFDDVITTGSKTSPAECDFWDTIF